MKTIESNELERVVGGTSWTEVKNAARGFAGGLACLGKFTVDGTPSANSYDTYLACQRKAHQF